MNFKLDNNKKINNKINTTYTRLQFFSFFSIVKKMPICKYNLETKLHKQHITLGEGGGAQLNTECYSLKTKHYGKIYHMLTHQTANRKTTNGKLQLIKKDFLTM